MTRLELVYGSQFRAVFESLAQLRIAVFREFPYLYAGTVAYETEYLETYALSERSMGALVYDGSGLDGPRLVGASTCLPLTDETAEVQAPFLAHDYDPKTVFYFGESILLPACRGQGWGLRFFREREAHARSFGTYQLASFCAVQRPTDHPMRPTNYRPLDLFWSGLGYRKTPKLTTTFDWPDLGQTESTPKPMQFWTKPL